MDKRTSDSASQHTGYASTAYNSKNFVPQEHAPQRGFLRRMMTKGTQYSFTKPNHIISIAAIKYFTPEYMKEVEAEIEAETDPERKMFWNEERLSGKSFNGWGQLYVFLVAFAKILLQIFLPLTYIIASIPLFFSEYTIVKAWNNGVSDLFLGITLYFTLPCLLIYGHSLLLNAGYVFLAPFLQSKKVFELNRKTGMVTLFRRNKVRFSHPLIEFDCVLLSSPGHQGHLSYSLMLIHRYNNYNVGVPISSTMLGANEKLAEYRSLWLMIQRYMDISQPLPDIMALEEARERDPTTVAYDKMHKRNPRYWRDMNDEAFEKALAKIKSSESDINNLSKKLNIFKS